MKHVRTLPTSLFRKLHRLRRFPSRRPAPDPAPQVAKLLPAVDDPFLSAFQHSLTGIAITTPEGRFLYVNPALLQILGYSEAELRVTPYKYLTHPDDRKRLYQHGQDLLEGVRDHFELEKRYVHRQGHVFWALLRTTLVRDAQGRPSFFVANVQNIDPHRVTLAALQESEEKYRTLTEQSFQGIFIADTSGMIYVNDRLESLTGYTRQELLAMDFDTMSRALLHPDDRETMSSRLRQRLGGNDLPQGYEYRFLNRAGEVHWAAVYSRLIHLGGKAVLQCTVVDLTERKRTEEVLQKARDTLEARVEERTRELAAANQEVRRFAYMISHDLRAPLVNLQGFASELQESLNVIRQALEPLLPQVAEPLRGEVVAALDQEAPDALGFIRNSVQRMGQMITAVMTVARVDQAQLDLQPVAAGELVEQALQGLHHQLEVLGVQVTVRELPEVLADRLGLSQIFANLLSNAINYLEPSRRGEIEVWAETGDQETAFHVRDNGRGIAPEDTERVFELFRRVGPQVSPGEGMGLTYVRAMVQRHGGTISCCSRLGAGSVFRFTLPHHPPDAST